MDPQYQKINDINFFKKQNNSSKNNHNKSESSSDKTNSNSNPNLILNDKKDYSGWIRGSKNNTKKN